MTDELDLKALRQMVDRGYQQAFSPDVVRGLLNRIQRLESRGGVYCRGCQDFVQPVKDGIRCDCNRLWYPPENRWEWRPNND